MYVVIIALLCMMAVLPAADAKLWELVVEINPQAGPIETGGNLTVTGRVVDHAYDPIRGAQVDIRAGHDSARTFTDPAGRFTAVIPDMDRAMGTYIVNVVSAWYNMTGLATTSFETMGEGVAESALEQQLSTRHAARYLEASASDFVSDPIGMMLYAHYQALQQRLAEQKELESESQIDLHEGIRRTAQERILQDVSEYKPGYGVFEGWSHDSYVDNLNPDIKDLIKEQLNYTKNKFEYAQAVRDAMLNNGTTHAEAQKAYLELISTPKEALEEFNRNNTQPQ